ncbi:hypothetical protein GCM10010124_15580 [Pilimelia terevasa]|uniref:Uncharacterized protein n=1 Tax=Pilimelia terevasa TaxID=53372 RepID=A0A8J3BNK4_9ACTN|nr:hypothetical protein [Pilimelia terevasa]GGK23932.1 hypothetical protein GCM10010124_15580 [Pilimelia terevasa]
MTEGSSGTLTVDAPADSATDRLVSALRAFADGHGGATAVVEYVGRRGARIVLVGKDGVWGDQFAQDTDTARRACELAALSVENSWERELVESMAPTNDLWRSMGRRLTAR